MPQTMNMPTAEEMDQAETDTTVETHDEAGQEVGEVATAQGDWDENGAFIGKCELVEVPFRKTVKSKATIRVVQDGDAWRTGLHWQTLLKVEGLQNIGLDLCRRRVGFPTKREAVFRALTELASMLKPVDERMKEDVLKFRGAEFWIETDDAGNTVADQSEAAGAEHESPDARHPDEPRANEHGVLDTDVETVSVPMPKAWKASATVTLAEDSFGWWYAGYSYENGKSDGDTAGSGPPKLGDAAFRSKKAALLHALDAHVITFQGVHEKAADKIDAFRQEVAANWAEEITALDPDAGEKIDEPAPTKKTKKQLTEAEQQAKAEREFRKQFIEVAEELADAVLERRRAEEIYKTAKAREKMCGEMLETIADRGPERYPLIEAAEAKAVEKPASESAPAAASDDAWKSRPLSELNLPAGLFDKLIGEGLDTIGRLEQRRADIATGREKWPKGVGTAAITKIEDAVLAWLKVNQHDNATVPEPIEQDAAESAAAESKATPVAHPSTTSSTTPSGIAANDPEATGTTPAAGKGKPDPGDIGDVAGRLMELIANEAMGEFTNPIYQDGRRAHAEGWVISDCTWTPGPNQDQWLLGYNDAEDEAAADENGDLDSGTEDDIDDI